MEMNKVKIVKGIVKLYFVGALAGSFIHIVSAAHYLGGEGIEAFSVPFMIDGIAIIGMVMRGTEFSKRTNKIGFIVQCIMGAFSLTMNVLAGVFARNAFAIMFGVAIVALFVFAEWLSDQIESNELDAIREAEGKGAAAYAFLGHRTHRTPRGKAQEGEGKDKGKKARGRKARARKTKEEALESNLLTGEGWGPSGGTYFFALKL